MSAPAPTRPAKLERFYLGLFAFLVLGQNAYPTITWWDSPNYSLAAATLGLTGAPGSLLLTLLGWPIAHLPFISTPARALILFAAAIAAATIVLVYVAAIRVLRLAGVPLDASRRYESIGAVFGAAAFAFSTTLWEHAIKFTPYVLSALITALILLTLLRWWADADQPDAWRWLALLALLFGLDFSVHRTNALLMPSALVWILLRDPRTFAKARTWVAGAGGLAIGLAVQLLVIPIAMFTRSPLNMGTPRTWSAFWDYVSLSQAGGGFLINLWPRKSDFWSVQVADLLRTLGENFLHWNTFARVAGVLPAVLFVVGFVALVRRNRRLGIALALLILLQAATTVVYFNIPANFFRPFDRHYLPICVSIGVVLACGGAAAVQWLSGLAAARPRLRLNLARWLVAIVPGAQFVANLGPHDASHNWFTRDYAVNALEMLPPNAIYFTVGDNDTFPLWYMQTVEGVRRDVQIINISLANAPWYIDHLRRLDPSLPLTLTGDSLARIGMQALPDSVVIAVPGSPDTVRAKPTPMNNPQVIPADHVLLDLVRTNAWRRPLAFASTTGTDIGWLGPYARLEGLHRQILPEMNPPIDRELLRRNLLEIAQYRGFATRRVRIDQTTRTIGFQYVTAILALADADLASGARASCTETIARLLALIPPERIGAGASYDRDIAARCR